MPRLLPQRTARFQSLPRAAASFNQMLQRNASITPFHQAESMLRRG